MKKYFVLLLAAAVLLSLAACGGQPVPETAAPTTTATETEAPVTAAPTEPPTETTVYIPTEEDVLQEIEELLWDRNDASGSLALALRYAEEGYVGGMYYAGKLLLDGDYYDGVEADIPQGLTWLEKAAALDNTDAMALLGFVYTYGTHGQTADLQVGIGWMERGAELGSYACMNNLGNYLTWTDPEAGLPWLEKALGSEDAYSRSHTYINLAYNCAQRGDREGALEYTKKAGEKDPSAYQAIAEHFSGQLSDYATALKIYEAGGEDGVADCMYMAGEMYEKGLGTPADPAKAVEWYTKAKDAGSAKAFDALERLK